MKITKLLNIIVLLAGAVTGRAADSTDIMFDDTVIHEFDLHFYTDNWVESLEQNYELGELYMPVRVTYGTAVLESVGVRYKGNSSYMLSAGTIKKSLKLKFDKYKDDQLLYGLEKLNFNNCTNDPSFMREKIAYDISAHYMPTPRAAYANITVDGEVLGLYTQVEQVDELFLHRHFSADTIFNLYKAGDDGADLTYSGSSQTGYYTTLELKTNEKENDWSNLVRMLDRLSNVPDGAFADTAAAYLDTDNIIRHLALIMTLSHFDSYTGSARNYYLYDTDGTGRFTLIPWDMNESFGRYSNNWDVYAQDIITVTNGAARPLHRRIACDGVLGRTYLGFIRELMDGPASEDSIAAMTVRLKALIDSSVAADPNKLYTYQNFLDNIDAGIRVGMGAEIPGINSFIQQRYANLETQLGTYLDITGPDTPGHTAAPYCTPLSGKTLTVCYQVPAGGTPVMITATDVSGSRETVLFSGIRNAGAHTGHLHTGSLPPGCAVVTVTVGTETTLLKTVITE